MVPQPGSFKDPKEKATGHDHRGYSKANGKLLDKTKSSSEKVHCAVVFVELDLVIVEFQPGTIATARNGRNVNIAGIGDEPVGHKKVDPAYSRPRGAAGGHLRPDSGHLWMWSRVRMVLCLHLRQIEE